jgi:hypothetical protein
MCEFQRLYKTKQTEFPTLVKDISITIIRALYTRAY